MLEGERAVFSVSAEIHRLLIYSSTSHLMQLRLCYARSWRSTCGGRRIWRRHLVAANAQGMAGGLNKPEGPRKARLRHRVGKPPLLHTLHEAIVLGASLTAGKHHSSPATSHYRIRNYRIIEFAISQLSNSQLSNSHYRMPVNIRDVHPPNSNARWSGL